ncbi:hypothetical protein B0H11DRAFT_1932269 [Mycena galericulata]|nr:hypothetical protein B0H11DRAFT_1932269 [Mycena galericulata]
MPFYNDGGDDSDSDRHDRYDEEEYEGHQRALEREVPESDYNEGLGIKYVIALQPKHPPLEPGTKRRSNAKLPDPVKSFTHVHEHCSLDEVLDSAFKAVDRNDRNLRYKIVGGHLRTDAFKITWSLPRSTTLKDMQWSSEKHYEGLISEVAKELKEKGKDNPEIKLQITELETAPSRDYGKNRSRER